ncbi:C1-like protein [Corchorus capsularis]|uniref:C1-like protein n=1 Tax=Corchorus capsularis TaxID=210143 RepID=A0A1R3GLG0_COCAP|nr:C1-like protein [Corchorus capsularis]
MEIQHFSHEHPLVLVEEQSHESDGDEKACCSGCGELVSGPCFSCVACGFHLDKKCAEASSELNHPFHSKHNFDLLKRHPYEGGCYCNFCGKRCENFVYHCSCNLDLHIKCGLLSYKIAEKKLGELQHISHIDPALISMENCNIEELQKAECFVCWMPLLGSKYLSADCGFYMHERCVDLPAEINLLWHPQHSLVLQFNSEGYPYRCKRCNFNLHEDCMRLPLIVRHKCDDHPLKLTYRDNSNYSECYYCDICEKERDPNHWFYFCEICNTSTHPNCVVDKNSSFIKPGGIYKEWEDPTFELVSSSAAEFLVKYKSCKDDQCDFFDWYDDLVCKRTRELLVAFRDNERRLLKEKIAAN